MQTGRLLPTLSSITIANKAIRDGKRLRKCPGVVLLALLPAGTGKLYFHTSYDTGPGART